MMKYLYRADFMVLKYVFMPIAYKIDYLWHINPYQQAANFMIASAVLTATDIAIYEIAVPKVSTFDVIFWSFVTLMVVGCRAYDISRLTKISKFYENNRDKGLFPIEMIGFILPYSRMTHLWLGVVLLAPFDLAVAYMKAEGDWLRTIIWFVPRCWFMVAGIGYYLAACPSPPKKRKEKEARAPLFGTLSSVKS